MIIILEIQKLAKLLRYILINRDTQKIMTLSESYDKWRILLKLQKFYYTKKILI